MFGGPNKEENEERQDYCLAPWHILEVLNREVTLLNDERVSLVDIEKKLLFMINEKIEAKIRNNEKLRLEVDKQKMTCVKLSRVLNSSIARAFLMVPLA